VRALPPAPLHIPDEPSLGRLSIGSTRLRSLSVHAALAALALFEERITLPRHLFGDGLGRNDGAWWRHRFVRHRRPSSITFFLRQPSVEEGWDRRIDLHHLFSLHDVRQPVSIGSHG
jgi:hypothetical protein